MSERMPDSTRATKAVAESPLEMQSILVPVDFSVSSRQAVNYAVAFARQFQARLTVVHVVELPYVGTGIGEFETMPVETELRDYGNENLAKLVEAQVADRVPHSTILRTGQAWFEITEAARETRADLIIMGTHGYTGLKHMLMGSTAERVVRHAPCPVLVVREREDSAATKPPSSA